jgi:hypothetical protein
MLIGIIGTHISATGLFVSFRKTFFKLHVWVTESDDENIPVG